MSYLLLCLHGPLRRQHERLRKNYDDCSCISRFVSEQLFLLLFFWESFYRSLSNAFTLRILERTGKRDWKRFAFISDFSRQSSVPQSFPRDVTMHHCCHCDCSYRLPSRYYLLFPFALWGLQGGHFYWSRHESKMLPRNIMATEWPD